MDFLLRIERACWLGLAMPRRRGERNDGPGSDRQLERKLAEIRAEMDRRTVDRTRKGSRMGMEHGISARRIASVGGSLRPGRDGLAGVDHTPVTAEDADQYNGYCRYPACIECEDVREGLCPEHRNAALAGDAKAITILDAWRRVHQVGDLAEKDRQAERHAEFRRYAHPPAAKGEIDRRGTEGTEKKPTNQPPAAATRKEETSMVNPRGTENTEASSNAKCGYCKLRPAKCRGLCDACYVYAKQGRDETKRAAIQALMTPATPHGDRSRKQDGTHRGRCQAISGEKPASAAIAPSSAPLRSSELPHAMVIRQVLAALGMTGGEFLVWAPRGDGAMVLNPANGRAAEIRHDGLVKALVLAEAE
ncbi:MAG TPA: hypothetical protein VLL76_08835 [Candidatus Omnitrophota bacterium]|nr:hypothetical protein [Candidatus Omnitrophota bacterium]